MATTSDPKEQAEAPVSALTVPEQLLGPDGPFANLLKANPMDWMQQGMEFYRTLFEIAAGTSTITPDPRDWRFQHETWTKNPLYRRLAQAYLALTEAVEAMIPDDLEGDAKARAELATAIVTSAFSPTNTLLGNPAAMLKAIDTKGDSLAHGFRNLVDDWLNNGGMPSQVDDSQFKVGKNLAVTPGKVVHKTEMFELIQYAPSTETVYPIPVLVIPPQIGRYYFTDLAPGRSFAEYAVAQGMQQFVISWRNPGPDQRDWTLDDYVAAAIEAMETVAEISGQKKINIVAFCAGGILTSIALAHLAAKGREIANSLALCVTMLNFDTDAAIGSFRLGAMLSVARAQSKMKGILPGEDLHKVFTWLRPNDLVWNYWVNNYLMGDAPAAFDILAWNKDSTNMAGALHGDFLKIFKENPLVKQGCHVALGEPIDLSKITCDNFVVGAVTDHITPWKGCYLACKYLGGTSTFALSNGGHVAALVNPPDNPKAHHFLGLATAPDADTWLESAEKKSGSWWKGWAEWCAERNGERVKAPKQLGSKKHPPGVAAPGTYVLQ
jgi:poly[(R)-3-hydroxyalkanoate] polymerase subunit PhaC